MSYSTPVSPIMWVLRHFLGEWALNSACRLIDAALYWRSSTERIDYWNTKQKKKDTSKSWPHHAGLELRKCLRVRTARLVEENVYYVVSYMSLPFHLKEIFEKEVNFSNKSYSIFMFNADYQWDDQKKYQNYIFFFNKKELWFWWGKYDYVFLGTTNYLLFILKRMRKQRRYMKHNLVAFVNCIYRLSSSCICCNRNEIWYTIYMIETLFIRHRFQNIP